jgi:hypothetical protein
MKTKTFLLFIALTLCITSTYAQKERWESLFNGKDLSQWKVYGHPKDVLKQYWKVENSVIVADTKGDTDHDYVWLGSRKEYKDFELKLQFAAFRSSKGNSGVQVRSRYDQDSLWLDGPQIDINPPETYRMGMMWDETREIKRWIFPDLPKGEWVNEKMAIGNPEFYYSDDSLKWNDLKIRVEGFHIQAWLNGVLITDYKGDGFLNDKFHKAHNVGEKGIVALQIHIKDDLKIMYREIYVRML